MNWARMVSAVTQNTVKLHVSVTGKDVLCRSLFQKMMYTFKLGQLFLLSSPPHTSQKWGGGKVTDPKKIESCCLSQKDLLIFSQKFWIPSLFQNMHFLL